MIEGPLTAAFVASAAAVLKPKACVHDFLCLLFRDELQSIASRNSGKSRLCVSGDCVSPHIIFQRQQAYLSPPTLSTLLPFP
jgi:hypothetical protein